jgi:hypothetical protein
MSHTSQSLRRCVLVVLAGWLLSAVAAFAQTGYCDRAEGDCFSGRRAAGHRAQAGPLIDARTLPLGAAPHQHAKTAPSAHRPFEGSAGGNCGDGFCCGRAAEPLAAAVTAGLDLTVSLNEIGRIRNPHPAGPVTAPRPHPLSFPLYLQKHTLII